MKNAIRKATIGGVDGFANSNAWKLPRGIRCGVEHARAGLQQNATERQEAESRHLKIVKLYLYAWLVKQTPFQNGFQL